MQDVRWAVRSLRKQAGFTALALVTLALGIGATTVAFTVLDAVLLKPLPFAQPGQLVLIREKTANGRLLPASYPNFDDWRTQARSFSGVAASQSPETGRVWIGADPIRAVQLGVSRGFFETLGVTPVVGRTFTNDENRVGGACVVMVAEEFWKGQMGGREPLGDVHFGSLACPVVGVVPAGFRLSRSIDIYYPLEGQPGTVRSAHNYQVVARLRPGIGLDAARHEMTALSAALARQYGNATMAANVLVQPLRDYLVGSYRLILLIVFGAATLVLFIACTNLLSAQLARGMRRHRELAVRAALGATRRRVIRQLFVESVVLAFAGGALGVGFAALMTRVVRLLGTGLVPRLEELRVDGRVLAFVAAVVLLTSFVIGLFPAVRLAERDPSQALRGSGRSGGTAVRNSVWQALVGFEVAMAVVLIVGSALLVRSLHNILTADTGFDPRGLVTAEFSPGDLDVAAWDNLRRELAALPGADGAAYSTQMPLEWGNYSAPALRPGDSPDHDWPAMAGFRAVSSGYFAVLRQRLVRGREFTDADRAGSPPVAVVSTGLANALWPGRDPIGQTIASNYTGSKLWYTVVGVATEASNWNTARGSQNEMYIPLAQQPEQARSQNRLVAFVRARGDSHALIPAIRARMHQLAPQGAPTLGTVEDRIASSASDRRFAMFALVVFGVIALVLASAGVYGVMAYVVSSRRYEIGLRMALGETPGGVRRRMLGAAAGMAGGGIVVGGLLAAVTTRYVQSQLYGVSRFDPWAYAAGAGLLLAAALLGAYVPARQSSLTDPALTMRADG